MVPITETVTETEIVTAKETGEKKVFGSQLLSKTFKKKSPLKVNIVTIATICDIDPPQVTVQSDHFSHPVTRFSQLWSV